MPSGGLGSLTPSSGAGAPGGWGWLTQGFQNPGGTGIGSGGLGGLLSGITGSQNPLFDMMALISFVNQGQLTQEQMGFIKDVLDQQSSSMGTASDPNKLSAFRTAETPHGLSPEQLAGMRNVLTPGGAQPYSADQLASLRNQLAPGGMQPYSADQLASLRNQLTPGGADPWSTQKFGNVSNRLTNQLSQPFIENTLNPVNAELAAQGQATSPATSQYVSEQALAPFNIQEQQMGQAGAQNLLQQHQFDLGLGQQSVGQMFAQNQFEQGLGAQGAGQLFAQNQFEQGLGQQGMQDLLNQFLTQQNMGQNMTQFGLQLPFSAQPKYPNFGVVDPGQMQSLMQLLQSGGFGGGFGGFATNPISGQGFSGGFNQNSTFPGSTFP